VPTNNYDLTFTCHELEQSAYLWARGIRFTGIQPAPTPWNPKHFAFQFHDPDGLCKETLGAYDHGAEIPARLYALALKQLKDQLFQASKQLLLRKERNTHTDDCYSYQRPRQFPA
jgi:hypothetical protein